MQAMAGLFASISLLIVSFVNLSSSSIGLVYFSIAALTVFLCLISFILLLWLPYAKKYLQLTIEIVNVPENSQNSAINSETIGNANNTNVFEYQRSSPSESEISDIENKNSLLEKYDNQDEKSSKVLIEYDNHEGSFKNQFVCVMKSIWLECFMIFFVFFITLSCFPTIMAAVRSTSDNKLWTGLKHLHVIRCNPYYIMLFRKLKHFHTTIYLFIFMQMYTSHRWFVF